MGDLAWINERITSIDEATVPLMDYGYLFGYGVYEAFKVYNGRPYAVKEHLDRLEKNLKEMKINPRYSREDVINIINSLIEKSGYNDAGVYLHFTKGVGPRNHSYLSSKEPVSVIFVSYLPPIANSLRQKGISAITQPDNRWANPNIKTLNLLPNILAKQIAEEMGAYEAILVRDNGCISEGASSNVFAVFGDRVVTPPADGKILPGITRLLLFKIAQEHHIDMREEYLKLDDLRMADEIFITNAGIEVLPVTVLDGNKVGTGKVGPFTNKLYSLFMQKVEE